MRYITWHLHLWKSATQPDIRTSDRALHNLTFVPLAGCYTTWHSYLWKVATKPDVRTSVRALHSLTFVPLVGRYTAWHSYLWKGATQHDIRTSGRVLHSLMFVPLVGRYTTWCSCWVPRKRHHASRSADLRARCLGSQGCNCWCVSFTELSFTQYEIWDDRVNVC